MNYRPISGGLGGPNAFGLEARGELLAQREAEAAEQARLIEKEGKWMTKKASRLRAALQELIAGELRRRRDREIARQVWHW
jgi:hypothetical protein